MDAIIKREAQVLDNLDKKVLIIGAGGYLGSQLKSDISVIFKAIPVYYPPLENQPYLDITNKKNLREVFSRYNPDVVILTSAKTDVEDCERNPKDAWRVNVSGVENIVENLDGRKIVFYSTDAIFDGKKEEYLEEDSPNPINIYGKSKLEAEKIITSCQDYLICRTSRLYGLTGGKFLNKIIYLLSQGKEVQVPAKTKGNFTLINDLSQATIELIKLGKTGIYHVVGDGAYSFDEAALKIAEIFEFDSSLIKKVDSDFFNTTVKRANSVLNTNKLIREGIKMSSLAEGLRFIKNHK
jgi:dTDP-4-dehydrorhamnose reductase